MSLNALRELVDTSFVDVDGRAVAHAIEADPESVDRGLVTALTGLVCDSGYAVADGDTDELIYGLENAVHRIAESDAVREDLEAELDSVPEVVAGMGKLSAFVDYDAAEKRFAEARGMSLTSLGTSQVWVEVV